MTGLSRATKYVAAICASAQRLGDRAASGRGRDAGAVTILFAVGLAAVMLIIGLSVDVSGLLRAKDRARAIAEQAARYGAEQISTGALLDGDGTQLQSQTTITNLVCQHPPLPSDATCVGMVVLGPDTVTVTVTLTYHSLLHSMIGTFPDYAETESATALLIPLPPPPTP